MKVSGVLPQETPCVDRLERYSTQVRNRDSRDLSPSPNFFSSPCKGWVPVADLRRAADTTNGAPGSFPDAPFWSEKPLAGYAGAIAWRRESLILPRSSTWMTTTSISSPTLTTSSTRLT